MADRNQRHESLILKSRESPSGSRVLTLMSADAGLVDVFVFGGGKSKLRSLASPYVHGNAFIYADPVKEYRKLNDFEVLESFSGIRESLARLWGASVIAEMLLRSSGGGGDFAEITNLALDALRALEGAREAAAPYPVLLFLWRLLGIIGVGPDIFSCASCAQALDEPQESPAIAVFLAAGGDGLLCPACASLRQDSDEGFTPDPRRAQALSKGALRWLQRAETLCFDEALRVSLDAESLAGLKSLVYPLARQAAEAPLFTLEEY